jgi:HD-like signal output (HDOD) protein
LTGIILKVTSQLLKNRPSKKDVIDAVDNLPPMPRIMHQARKIIEDPNSSFRDLEKLIITDQAFAIKILKIANSTYYGRIKKISSIQDAAVVIGMKTLAELINITSASSVLNQTLRGYDLAANSLWQHSIGVALGSKIVAGRKFTALADEAFTAGLIHDAGKLILDRYVF